MWSAIYFNKDKNKHEDDKEFHIKKRKQIIYSWSANIVNVRFIVLSISKKLRHKFGRRSYLEFIRIAFRYAQIFFRYEPVSFLFRFMWVFFAKAVSLSPLSSHSPSRTVFLWFLIILSFCFSCFFLFKTLFYGFD